jgi:SAM-dependent methyltransferase
LPGRIAEEKLTEVAECPVSPMSERGAVAAHHLSFAAALRGSPLDPGAKILDFGCGLGSSVAWLLNAGVDAYGVDIHEYWGRDYDAGYWKTPRPDSAVTNRLSVIEQPYRIPFPDGSFDLCFSDQVMEHVFDYRTVFSEIGRVLKPDGISLHRFPGPNRPFEEHIYVPLPWLCRSRAYLCACALLGFRAPDQHGLGWREVWARNVECMRGNNYPTKRTLVEIARAAGLQIMFVERQDFHLRGWGSYRPLFDRAQKLGLESAALTIGGLFLQRYMLLRRPARPAVPR